MRLDWNEQGHTESESIGEIHPRIREGPVLSGNLRPRIRTRAILASELESELVVDIVGEIRDQTAVDRVGVILLDRIGASRPGIDVEGAVILARVGEVILERRDVDGVDAPIQLDHCDLRIIGTLNRTEVAGEHATECGREICLQRIEGRIGRAGLLLYLRINLLIISSEVKELVLHDRTAQCDAKLVLPEIGFESEPGMRRVGGERTILSEIMKSAMHLVGAPLGDHVDEATARSSELGV